MENIQEYVDLAYQIVNTALVVLGLFSAIARFTPTKKDDVWVQKVLDAIHLLGLTKKSG